MSKEIRAARVEDGLVVNIEVISDANPEDPNLIVITPDTGEAFIGETYDSETGTFSRPMPAFDANQESMAAEQERFEQELAEFLGE